MTWTTRSLCLALLASTGCVAPSPELPTGTGTGATGTGAIDHGVPAALQPAAAAQSWTPLTNPAPFGAGVAMLLTDGTVMTHAVGTEAWWRLTPDADGSYVNGSWSPLASMAAGYTPTYFGSAVLPDGRVIVEGGEYINNQPVLSNQGALYDPVSNTWTPVAPPAGWDRIGDASSLVLADGTFMLSSAVTPKTALLDLATMTWRSTGVGKADVNDEESWTVLPDDTVLTVDCGATHDHAEIYNPPTGTWTTIGATPALVDLASGEIGPAVLRADGTVFLTGGNGHNATYDPKTRTFAAAPSFPIVPEGQLDVADGPAALLPNGNVLVIASPGAYNPPIHTYEWNGTALTEVASPPNAQGQTSYALNMLVLPTGEILTTNFTADVEVYTPAPGVTDNAIPVITDLPKLVTAANPDPLLTEAAALGPTRAITPELLPVMTISPGRTYKLRGTQLHGISHGAYYGDDAQAYTNYPIVRLTSTITGHVTYTKTHDHSTMSIRPGTLSTTRFDVPATAERGVSSLEVVVNGIASPPMLVNVK